MQHFNNLFKIMQLIQLLVLNYFTFNVDFQVAAYTLGDGSSLLFYDSSKSVIPDADMPPLGSYDLVFQQVADMDAYTNYPYTATLKLTPAFFTWMCPDHCGGLSSTDYLSLAVPDATQQADCADGTATQTTAGGGGGTGTYSTTMKDIQDNEGTTAWRNRCLFWHVNIHSCPSILNTGEAAFCTPYLGKSVATHTPAQSIIGAYSGANVVVTANFNVEITTVDKLATDYMTIVHFKFGSGSTISIAAGWNHKIFSFAEKTKCPSGFVPNPDGTCATCSAGHYANQPTLGTPVNYDRSGSSLGDKSGGNNDVITTNMKVDDGTWTLSTFSDTNYCVQCPRGTFWGTASTASAMAASQCTQCPLGHYTDNIGSTSCSPCTAGYYQDNLGQSVCFPCSVGSYQPDGGQSSCIRAPDGKYVATKAASAPTACPSLTMTTNGEGSAAASECVCPPDTFMVGLATPTSAIGTSCEPCPVGFKCKGGRVEFAPGQFRHRLPVLKPGFYSEIHTPNEAYDCRNEYRCPGGNEPAFDYFSTINPICTSNADPTEINCGRCKDDYHFSGNMSECDKCDGSNYFYFILLVLMFVAAFVVVYIVANSPITVEMSPLLSASISLGVTLSMMQALGVIGSLAMTWPSPLKEIMGFLKLLVFDLESFGASCVMGDDPLGKLIGRQLIPLIIIGAYSIAYFVFKCEKNKCVNSSGMLLVALFSAFAVAGFSPFACYSGPNNKEVMLSEPSVLCDFDADGHNYLALWIVGLITFLAYPVGGLLLIITKIRSAPAMSLDENFLKSYRFLFFRFRPDRYYWMPILLLRNTSIAFPAVIFSTPQSQCLSVLVILLISLVAQIRVWPWRSNQLNYFDCVSVCCIILLLCFWFPTAPEVSNDQPYTTGAFLVLIFLFCFTCFIFSNILVSMAKDMGIIKGDSDKSGTKYSKFMEQRARSEVLELIMSQITRWRGKSSEKSCKKEIEALIAEFTSYDLTKSADVFFLIKLHTATLAEKKEMLGERGSVISLNNKSKGQDTNNPIKNDIPSYQKRQSRIFVSDGSVEKMYGADSIVLDADTTTISPTLDHEPEGQK